MRFAYFIGNEKIDKTIIILPVNYLFFKTYSKKNSDYYTLILRTRFRNCDRRVNNRNRISGTQTRKVDW